MKPITKRIFPLSKNQQLLSQEAQLVRQLKKRDSQAIEYLYENYSSALYGIILRMIKIDAIAEEVLQDVFLTIWQRIDKYDPAKGRLFTWMYQITRNQAIDKLRSREMKAWQREHGRAVDWRAVESSQYESMKTDTLGLENLLPHLKPKQKEVLYLVYMKGYSHKEVAEQTGLPHGTIKSTVRKGLQEIRKMLRRYQFEEIQAN